MQGVSTRYIVICFSPILQYITKKMKAISEKFIRGYSSAFIAYVCNLGSTSS